MPENIKPEIKAEIEEQIKGFDKLIAKYPHLEELYIGRAILYAKIGEYEKAVKDFETGHENYIYDIVAVCKRLNLSEGIEEFYTKKMNKEKNNIVNYISRARFYMTIGENQKALADCENILKMFPGNKLVLKIKETAIEELKNKQKRNEKMKTPKVFRT